MAAFVEQAEVAVAVAMAATPGADVVGNAFVHQYYLILHQSPELLHRFYQDVSKIGRMEENGTMSITNSMQAINEKILSLHYGELSAQILTMDAQDSFNGGVFVLVTGYLIRKDSLRRKFTQGFFLAPQDKGYFVLNDVFRYVDDGSQSFVNDVEVPLTPDPEPTLVEENHVSETAAELSEVVDREVYNPPKNGQASIEEEEVPVAKVVDEVSDEWQIVAESNSKTEEVPKKSYASIMSDTMHEDIDDGLRFRNCNCFCGLRASVRISDKRNDNRYRLFQCCPKEKCGFFQWCISLKTPLSYAEDFQLLQEELCVLREELRVMHDKVHPLDQTKKRVKIMFIGWCLLCTTLVLLLTMTMV